MEPAFLVDVCSVGLVPEHHHFRTEFLQNFGSGFVGDTVTAIHDDAHSFQRHSAGKGRLGVFHEAPQRVVDPGTPCQSGWRWDAPFRFRR